MLILCFSLLSPPTPHPFCVPGGDGVQREGTGLSKAIAVSAAFDCARYGSRGLASVRQPDQPSRQARLPPPNLTRLSAGNWFAGLQNLVPARLRSAIHNLSVFILPRWLSVICLLPIFCATSFFFPPRRCYTLLRQGSRGSAGAWVAPWTS